MATATVSRPISRRAIEARSAPYRLDWVDLAKGIGILLVVFGHVWRGLESGHFPIRAGLYSGVDDWIYSFHMPLFFVLSGLFAGRSAARSSGTYLADKLRTIAYPYLLWSLIQGSVNLVMSRHTNSPLTAAGLVEQIAIRPYAQFWFLYALMIQFILFLPLFKAGMGTKSILLAAIVTPIALRLGDVPLVPILGVALNAFGYFALGHLLEGWLRDFRTPSPRWARACFGLAAVAGLMLGMGAWAHLLFRPGVRVGASLLGIAGVLAASLALANGPGLAWLRAMGRASLPIFVAHVLATAATRMLLVGVVHTRNLPIHLALGTIAGLVFPMLLDATARRFGMGWLFAWKRNGATQAASPAAPSPFFKASHSSQL